MSGKIVQINYRFSVSASELGQGLAALAGDISRVEGLRWKIWLMNEAEGEAGGIYLFENEECANAYLTGPIVAGFAKHPAVSDVSVQLFDPDPGLSAVTRGPI
jgi:hypothetical protein